MSIAIIRKKTIIFRLVLAVIIVFIFVFSLDDINQSKENKEIEPFIDQRITFEATIVAMPDIRIDHQKLVLGDILINQSKIKAKVLATTGLYPDRQYGSVVKVTCFLQKPEPFNGFAYDRYLAKSGIFGLCNRASIYVVNQSGGKWWLKKIYDFKNKTQYLINQSLPEPHASMLSAMILANRRGIPDQIREQFSISGVSHILAISGLHITLLITILDSLILSLSVPRKYVFPIITVAVIVYLVLIGFPASAVRASIMGWLVLLGRQSGRMYASGNAILLAVATMLFINPQLLRDDAGFQLSFAAVLGIVYLSPIVEPILKRVPKTFGLQQSLLMTFSAQISTAPLIIYLFSQFSVIAPVTNLLILPMVPYIMITGLGAIAINVLFPLLESPIWFWPVGFLLHYLTVVVQILASFNFAAIKL